MFETSRKDYDFHHFRTSQCELYIDVDCRNLRDLFESQKHEFYSRQRDFWTHNLTKRNASIPHTLAGTYLSKIEPLRITHEEIRLGANVFKKSSCKFFPDIISAQTWWMCWQCSRSLLLRTRRRSRPGDSSTAPRGCKHGIFMHLRHCLCFLVHREIDNELRL